MTGAWYWYVDEGHYGDENAVRIHAEKPGRVRGQYWVIPVKDDHYQRWHIYLQPKWYVEGGLDQDSSVKKLDCEWVFVKREKWVAPPKEMVDYQCEVCECCGQEVWL